MENKEIKELRKKMKMSREAFAYLIGVSYFTVVRWENEKLNIKPHRIAKEKLEQLKAKHAKS